MENERRIRYKRIYNSWRKMVSRCTDKNDIRYKYYGGRGITICNEWNEFRPFYEWALANGYSDNLTIDRIDVNGNYEPSNCRWITMKEQCNNKTNNINVEYNGEIKTLKQWAEKYGVKYKLLHERYRRYGWEFERALLTPAEDWNITINGESHCLEEWARIKGVKSGTIFSRIRRGWSKENAIMKPVRKLNKRLAEK